MNALPVIPAIACVAAAHAAEPCRFHFDTAKAPNLADWTARDLTPVVRAWYPKLAALLASPGFTPPAEVFISFSDSLGAAPAVTSGNRITLNATWFAGQLQGEAKGCVVHELVHVIQQYGANPSRNPAPKPVPGWLTEGIADYLRWYHYEPQSKGAVLRDPAQARHDGSYRLSANFLDWVITTRDPGLLAKLNAAARNGSYSDDLWRQWTGHDLTTLATDWKAAVAAGKR